MNADADPPISEPTADRSAAVEAGASRPDGAKPTVAEPAGVAEFAPLRTRYWDVLFGLHLVAAIAWWWVMPGGFPVSHPRFWVNSVLPWVVVLLAAAGIPGLQKRNVRRTAALTTVVAAFWVTVVAVGCFVFPVTARHQVLPGLLVLLAVGGARFGLSPVPAQAWRGQLAAAIPALVIGVFVVFSQRGPAPSTHPGGERIADFVFDRNVDRSIEAFNRGGRAAVFPDKAAAVFSAGLATVEIRPLLRFESRSADRCWTNLAAEADRASPPLKEVGRRWTNKLAEIRYLRPAQTFSVDLSAPDVCVLEAATELDEAVYSHLNSFSELVIEGHGGELSLTFSPCGNTTITVPSSDYPVGRPIRFAYLGADGIFRVVEASSAEKGPFKTLAEGPLARDGSLTIGVRVDGRRAARVTFLDFASQASTELSPTAGWGLPQNAVEMRRMGDISSSPVHLWLTLAGTSVGRGFDSVGYAAGVYRNRVRIEIDKETE
jgi:hypothetical protein